MQKPSLFLSLSSPIDPENQAINILLASKNFQGVNSRNPRYKMPDMEGSVKTPQISEMFQKFALSFKSKAFSDESEKVSLLDSPEKFIAE